MPITESRVTVGIDAAVTANHHVIVRQPVVGGPGTVIDDFSVPPTLNGLADLADRLAKHHATVAMAEPTSMSWLGLSAALLPAGIELTLVGSRHVARLRGAVTGKNKSDVIDAELLSRAGEVFDLSVTSIPCPATLALQRACRRRHKALIEANRAWRRIVSLARWAFPDTWNAMKGSRSTNLAVLTRWPHLAALSRARVSSIADVISSATKGVADVTTRAERVHATAKAWVTFWDGTLDLDALAWELADLLDQHAQLQARVTDAGNQTALHWARLYGDDDLLLSIPGIGPTVGPTIRAFMGDGTRFASAKHAASFVGIAPSNWSSGTVTQPSRAITKEGPAALRLAFYQAANAGRRVDGELAEVYHRMMTQRGHSHAQATIAIARRLVGRTWATMTRGTPYESRDLDGNRITRAQAKQLAHTFTVPGEVRKRARAHTATVQRGRLTR